MDFVIKFRATLGDACSSLVGGDLVSGFIRLVRSWLVAVGIGFLPNAPAQAQAMREVIELPRDCAQFIPAQARGTLQPWQVFVRLEHCDRMKRLRRLSDILPADQRPRFYEGVVPASRLPGDFRADLPVLRVVFPDRTFFDTGRAALRPEARQVAQIIAESLRHEPPDVAMFVAGHADSRGSEGANEVLSENRADAVARSIYRLGVSMSSIWRIGFGEDMPLRSGTADADYAANRRVEFLFSAKPEAVGVWLADQQFEELCQSSSRSEQDECRKRLAFRDGYDAEVVNPRGAPLVLPQAPRVSDARIKPVGSRVRNIAPRGTETVTAKQPSVQARSAVIPSNTRKIRINPVNPDSMPVTVIL